jgi:hypothetical protein
MAKRKDHPESQVTEMRANDQDRDAPNGRYSFEGILRWQWSLISCG